MVYRLNQVEMLLEEGPTRAASISHEMQETQPRQLALEPSTPTRSDFLFKIIADPLAVAVAGQNRLQIALLKRSQASSGIWKTI
jgi:hypothetical protein